MIMESMNEGIACSLILVIPTWLLQPGEPSSRSCCVASAFGEWNLHSLAAKAGPATANSPENSLRFGTYDLGGLGQLGLFHTPWPFSKLMSNELRDLRETARMLEA